MLREAEEEIGARNITYKRVGAARFHRQVIGRDENHLFIVYEIATEDTIVLGKESESLEQFSAERLKKTLAEKPGSFGEAYYFVLETFYPDYLPKGWVKRWN